MIFTAAPVLAQLLSSPTIDRRRSQMESPIEVVRRFCAAWSDNVETGELAAFFTDDAVYHNIPQAPITGTAASRTTAIASFFTPPPPSGRPDAAPPSRSSG